MQKAPKRCGYERTPAAYALTQCAFDVVLLDLNLIDIDGPKSVAALHAEIPHVPLIVYSGSDDATLRKQAMRCGARQYLVKGRETGHSLAACIRHEISSIHSRPGNAHPRDDG